jgi:hypothetical protein
MPSFPAWLDTNCSVALIAGALCAVAIMIDVLHRPQKMTIMECSLAHMCAVRDSIAPVAVLAVRAGFGERNQAFNPEVRRTGA